MDAAGVAEFGLRFTHAFRQTKQQLQVDCTSIRDARRCGSGDCRIKSGGAAHAATGTRRESTRRHLGFQLHIGIKAYVNHIRTASTRFNSFNIGCLIDDSLAVQQTCRKVLIIPRGPHCRPERHGLDAEGRMVQQVLERRFHSDAVILLDMRIKTCTYDMHLHRTGGNGPLCIFG
jgi:hypothetical protein